MEKDKLIAEMSAEEKRKKAEEIFRDFSKGYFPKDMPEYCQHDFKMCSIVAYKLVREFFDPNGKMDKTIIASTWNGNNFLGWPLKGPNWLPVRYLGGGYVFRTSIRLQYLCLLFQGLNHWNEGRKSYPAILPGGVPHFKGS